MSEICPFKGITYNTKKLEKLDEVMSPPYDIISSSMQNELYKKNPYNFVKLVLGKVFDNDTELNNRYTRAKELYELWQKELILVESSKPSIFPYKIEYQINNKIKTMTGFFTLLKLDPEYKFVKAHEKTLSKPKADRLNLMRTCKSNLEPIQLLYIDEMDDINKMIDKNIKKPFINVTGYDGFTHKLWKLEDETIISNIQKKLKDKILFIADGHHRYQTAINFADEMKEKMGDSNENSPFQYRMVILANMFDKGLTILPTHRLIKKSDIDFEKFIDDLKKNFSIEKKIISQKKRNYNLICKKIKDDIQLNQDHKFAIYIKNKYYILTLKNEKIMNNFAPDHSDYWTSLDVSILHKIIIEHLLNIDESNLEKHVRYTRSDEDAIRFVDEEKYDLSILLNATKIDELKTLAESGEHMPQKSTFFLPKMLSGLVMYKMDI